MNKTPRISDAEWEVMEVVWERPSITAQEVVRALDTRDRRVVTPVGKWLGDDLLLEAAAITGGAARQAWELLGIPETTFRRRFRKASCMATDSR